jgi:prepilin-type N-terminal cleavage/methylation domain-containing protein
MLRALRRRLGDARGFGLVELIIAMFILTVAVSAMLSLYVATARSMQHAGQSGTALTLAEKQMETYRTVPFSGIRLDSAQIPTGSDPYVTAHSSDSTIPSSTGQAVGGQNGDTACPSPAVAACLPVQTVTGPDHRSYRIDTYVEYVSADTTFSHLAPAAGLTLKRVTVVTRDGSSTGKILARASSTFVLPG